MAYASRIHGSARSISSTVADRSLGKVTRRATAAPFGEEGFVMVRPFSPGEREIRSAGNSWRRVQADRVADLPFLHLTRPLQQRGDFHPAFVATRLSPRELMTVIGREQNERVLGLAGTLQCVEQVTDGGVEPAIDSQRGSSREASSRPVPWLRVLRRGGRRRIEELS